MPDLVNFWFFWPVFKRLDYHPASALTASMLWRTSSVNPSTETHPLATSSLDPLTPKCTDITLLSHWPSDTSTQNKWFNKRLENKYITFHRWNVNSDCDMTGHLQYSHNRASTCKTSGLQKPWKQLRTLLQQSHAVTKHDSRNCSKVILGTHIDKCAWFAHDLLDVGTSGTDDGADGWVGDADLQRLVHWLTTHHATTTCSRVTRHRAAAATTPHVWVVVLRLHTTSHNTVLLSTYKSKYTIGHSNSHDWQQA